MKFKVLIDIEAESLDAIHVAIANSDEIVFRSEAFLKSSGLTGIDYKDKNLAWTYNLRVSNHEDS